MYGNHKFSRRSVLKSVEFTLALAAFSTAAGGKDTKEEREVDIFSIRIPDLRVRNVTDKHVDVHITPESAEDEVLYSSSFNTQGIVSQNLPKAPDKLGGDYGDRFSVHVRHGDESIIKSFDKTRVSRYSGLFISVDEARGIRIHTAEV